MAKFRKISKVVDAVQWLGGGLWDMQTLVKELGAKEDRFFMDGTGHLIVKTSGALVPVEHGDWVVRDENNEYSVSWVYKPNDFEKTYEPVD